MNRRQQLELFAVRRRAQANSKRKPVGEQPPTAREFRAAMALYAPQRTQHDEPKQPKET